MKEQLCKKADDYKAQRDELLLILKIVIGKHDCGILLLPLADLERIKSAIQKVERS